MSVKSKLRKSVKEAIEAGLIDKKKQGALIEAAMKMAEVMDNPDWPIMDKKFDNVTPSTFLKYCEALHLTPGDIVSKDPEDETSILGKSKWKKTSADES